MPQLTRARRGATRLALLSLLLLAGAAPKSPAQDAQGVAGVPDEAADRKAREVSSLLVRLDGDPTLEGESLVAPLARLGASSAPVLFDVLVAVRYPVYGEQGVTDRVRLDRRLGEAIVAALGRLPHASLAKLVAESTRGSDERSRDIGMRLLASFGTSSDLRALVDLATPRGEEALHPKLVLRLESSVAMVLAREPASCPRIRTLLGEAHAGLCPALVRGLGAVRRREALDALAACLGSSETLDVLVLNQIGQVASQLLPPATDATRRAVRGALRSARLEVRREAALAVGWIEDSEAIGDLIDLVEDPEPGLRNNALWSLQAMTGLRLPAKAERWRAWHKDELRWWEESAQDTFAALSSDDLAEVSSALNEIGNRLSFHHELSEELVGALAHSDPRAQVLICGVLGRLRSRTALEALEERLEFADEGVRSAARAALRTIGARRAADAPAGTGATGAIHSGGAPPRAGPRRRPR